MLAQAHHLTEARGSASIPRVKICFVRQANQTKELDQKITPYIPARGKVKSNGLAHRMFSLFDKENHWQRITLNAHIAEAVTEVCEAAGRIEAGLNGLDVVPPYFGDAVGQGLLCAGEQWLSA